MRLIAVVCIVAIIAYVVVKCLHYAATIKALAIKTNMERMAANMKRMEKMQADRERELKEFINTHKSNEEQGVSYSQPINNIE